MTPLRRFCSPATLISRLACDVIAMAGRRGVVAARARVDRVILTSNTHQSQMFLAGRGARSAYQIEQGRAERRAFLADVAAGSPLQCFKIDPPMRGVGRCAVLRGAWGMDGWGVMPGSNRIRLVGGWWCRATQDATSAWSKYSKSWHSAHGPAIDVTARTLEIRRYNGQTGLVENRDVDLTAKGWRGQWWLDALIDSGIVVAVKVPARLRGVQLHRAYSVRLVRTIGSVEVFERSIAGDVVDFCVMWHGITYHAASQRDALSGLRQKMRIILRVPTMSGPHRSPIDYALCKKMEFCDSGIRQFCSDFGLEINGSYTADQVRDAVERRGRDRAVPYAGELATLARAVSRPDLAEMCCAG